MFSLPSRATQLRKIRKYNDIACRWMARIWCKADRKNKNVGRTDRQTNKHANFIVRLFLGCFVARWHTSLSLLYSLAEGCRCSSILFFMFDAVGWARGVGQHDREFEFMFSSFVRVHLLHGSHNSELAPVFPSLALLNLSVLLCGYFCTHSLPHAHSLDSHSINLSLLIHIRIHHFLHFHHSLISLTRPPIRNRLHTFFSKSTFQWIHTQPSFTILPSPLRPPQSRV